MDSKRFSKINWFFDASGLVNQEYSSQFKSCLLTYKFFESVEEFNGNFRAKLFLKLKFEDLVSEKLLKKK